MAAAASPSHQEAIPSTPHGGDLGRPLLEPVTDKGFRADAVIPVNPTTPLLPASPSTRLPFGGLKITVCALSLWFAATEVPYAMFSQGVTSEQLQRLAKLLGYDPTDPATASRVWEEYIRPGLAWLLAVPDAAICALVAANADASVQVIRDFPKNMRQVAEGVLRSKGQKAGIAAFLLLLTSGWFTGSLAMKMAIDPKVAAAWALTGVAMLGQCIGYALAASPNAIKLVDTIRGRGKHAGTLEVRLDNGETITIGKSPLNIYLIAEIIKTIVGTAARMVSFGYLGKGALPALFNFNETVSLILGLALGGVVNLLSAVPLSFDVALLKSDLQPFSLDNLRSLKISQLPEALENHPRIKAFRASAVIDTVIAQKEQGCLKQWALNLLLPIINLKGGEHKSRERVILSFTALQFLGRLLNSADFTEDRVEGYMPVSAMLLLAFSIAYISSVQFFSNMFLQAGGAATALKADVTLAADNAATTWRNCCHREMSYLPLEDSATREDGAEGVRLSAHRAAQLAGGDGVAVVTATTGR